MKVLIDRITIEYFEGSNYWEVKIDGQVVHTAPTQKEADLFVAELLLRMSR